VCGGGGGVGDGGDLTSHKPSAALCLGWSGGGTLVNPWQGIGCMCLTDTDLSLTQKPGSDSCLRV